MTAGTSEAARILSRLIEMPSTQTDLFEADLGVQPYLRETVAELANALGLRPEFDALGNLGAAVWESAARAHLEQEACG